MTAIILIFTFAIGFWLLWSVSKKQKDDPLDEWEVFQNKFERDKKTQIRQVKNIPKPPEKKMALKVRQKKVCVDMLLYLSIQQIDDYVSSLFDEDECEVIEAMKVFADERIAKYPVVPDGGLHEIVAYVKEHY